MEATKSLKHFRKRPLLRGSRERAGHNMSEHRESFEKGDADADPVDFGGRLASCGVPRHAFWWERGGSNDALIRGDWPGGHGAICQ
jgi:hypothetical protein